MTWKSWNIYYRDREYAKTFGDPLLGVVQAESKQQAEQIAASRGLGDSADVLACAKREVTANEDLPDCYFYGTDCFSDSIL